MYRSTSLDPKLVGKASKKDLGMLNMVNDIECGRAKRRKDSPLILTDLGLNHSVEH
jgi:hypothetical protein